MQKARGFVPGTVKVPRPLLRDDFLGAIGLDPGYAAPGVGGPERAVAFREDALGAMQILADVLNGGFVDFEIEHGIGGHEIGNSTSSKNLYVERSEGGA